MSLELSAFVTVACELYDRGLKPADCPAHMQKTSAHHQLAACLSFSPFSHYFVTILSSFCHLLHVHPSGADAICGSLLGLLMPTMLSVGSQEVAYGSLRFIPEVTLGVLLEKTLTDSRPVS